jgi:hypothetical protein
MWQDASTAYRQAAMAMRLDSISIGAAAGIYRANASLTRNASSRGGSDAYAGSSPNQVDTAVFSQEALEKAKILQQSGQEESPDASSESPRWDAQFQEEQDEALKESIDALAPDSTASEAEIKKAYYFLIKHYHPDRYEGFPPEFRKLAETKTAEIIDAYKSSIDRSLSRSRNRNRP